MKKQELAMAIGVAAFAMSTGMAHAANTITFGGRIAPETCDRVVKGGNYDVVLDEVAVSELMNKPGMYERIRTDFSIHLQCPPSVNLVGLVLGSSSYDGATGNFTRSGTFWWWAVQIRVMDGTDLSQQIVPGAAAPYKFFEPDENGFVSIPMSAFYFVKDASQVEAGPIESTAVYALRTQ